jgi:hypothetical protein
MCQKGDEEPREWPSREVWAERRRTFYADDLPDYVSRDVANYGTSEEIEWAIADLEALYKDLGRKMKAAKAEAGPLVQQPGEAREAYYARWRAMSPADQDLAAAPDEFREARKAVREIVEALRDGYLPSGIEFRQTFRHIEGLPSVTNLVSRHRAAEQAAIEAKRREVEQTPIDDEAWEEELLWRAKVGSGVVIDGVPVT